MYTHWNDAYEDDWTEDRHHGYAGCESELNPAERFSPEQRAITRAVNSRRQQMA